MLKNPERKVIAISVELRKFKLPDGRLISNAEFDAMKARGELKPGCYDYYDEGSSQIDGERLVVPPQPKTITDKFQQVQKLSTILQETRNGQLNRENLQRRFQDDVFLKWFIMPSLFDKIHNKQLLKQLASTFIDAGAEFRHLYLFDMTTPIERTMRMIEAIGDHINKYPLTLLSFLAQVLWQRNIALLQTMHSAGVNTNVRQLTLGGTVLHLFVANEHHSSEIIGTLVGAKIDFPFAATDSESKTALMIAVKTGNLAAVRNLIELHKKGIEIGLNTPDAKGRTPIMIAAALGFYEITEELLRLNCNITTKDLMGNGIMNYCSFDANIMREIFKEISIDANRHYLAERSWLSHPDKQSKLYAIFQDGKRELITIAKKGVEGEIFSQVLALAQNNPDPNLRFDLRPQVDKVLASNDNQSLLDMCLTKKTKTRECIQKHLNSLFFRACAFGDLTMMTKLISLGADPHAMDTLQRTALHYAVMRSELISELGQVDLLACRQAKPSVLEFLINLKIKDAPNKNGHTAYSLIERDCKSKNPWDQVNAAALKQKWDNIKLEASSVPPVSESNHPRPEGRGC